MVHLGAAISSYLPSSSGAESVTSLIGELRPLSSTLLGSWVEESKGGLEGPISQSSVSFVIIINSVSFNGKTRCSYGTTPSNLSDKISSVVRKPRALLLLMLLLLVLLFVLLLVLLLVIMLLLLLLLLRVRLRRLPGRSDDSVEAEDVDKEVVDKVAEVDIWLYTELPS